MKKIFSSMVFMLFMASSLFSLEVKDVQKVCQLTGQNSINHTELAGIKGTDLGIMIEYKRWIFFLFGDTFNTKDIHDPKAEWRSNVLAYSTDSDASDGILFDEFMRDKYSFAREMISSKKNKDETTVIPTGGITLGDRIWVSWMSVREWNQNGKWISNNSGYSYSDDAGTSFHKKSGTGWDGDSNFVQLAFGRISSDIYTWGIPSGRFGGIKLAKVNEGDFGSTKKYIYYMGLDSTGIPLWSKKENESVEIIPAPVGEISVAWNEYLQRWILTYLNEEKHALVIRDALDPWGPWSEEKVLLNGTGEYTGLYGAFIHPRYFENNGQTIYFLTSLWSKYNVVLFKATLGK